MPRDGCAVLVVDDDRINRGLLCRLLEHEGYRVRTAVDGREALAALEEERFDAVLLDIVMPEVDGMEVLRTLKGDVRLWHIPVIMISGVEDTDSVVACLELGADDYVHKPFDPVVLRARLNACLARRQFSALEGEYQKMVAEQAAELSDLRREANGAGDDGATVSGLDDPRARRRPVAVLAVGLGGVHDLAAEADPRTTLGVVASFQAAVAALAVRFGGAVTARAADALTVVFGGAAENPDPAAAAVGMAVALDEEMSVLVTGWTRAHHPPPTWGAGVAVGEACVGGIGSAAPQVAVVGPVVDRAARLAVGGRTGGVLLDEGAVSAARSGGTGVDAELEERSAGSAAPGYRLRRPRPPVEGGRPSGAGSGLPG